MSKIIDDLYSSSPSKKRTAHSRGLGSVSDEEISKANYKNIYRNKLSADREDRDKTNERISNIFFGKGNPSSGREDNRHPADSKPDKGGPGVFPPIKHLLPVIFIFAILLAFIAFDKINISINVVGSQPESGAEESSMISAETVRTASLPPYEVTFNGSAKDLAKVLDDKIVLVNSMDKSWSNMVVSFARPVDLKSDALSFDLMGKTGNERLSVSVSDGSGRKLNYFLPFDTLSKEWQRVDVSLPPELNLDTQNISDITIEYGMINAGNFPGAVIYVRDFRINKQ